MDAATVVADHAAEGAARVSRRIGRVSQVMPFGGLAQPVQNDPRLNRGQSRFRIKRAQLVHIARIVKDHGHIGALARQARPRAARQHSGSSRAAGCQRSLHVRRIPRQHHAQRKLTVIRRVGCIESPGAKIEAHVAAHCRLQKRFQLAVRVEALMVKRGLIQQLEDSWNTHDGMVACFTPG